MRSYNSFDGRSVIRGGRGGDASSLMRELSTKGWILARYRSVTRQLIAANGVEKQLQAAVTCGSWNLRLR